MKINWKVRLQSKSFWVGLIGIIGAPISAALGVSVENLTTWPGLINVIVGVFSNPSLIFTLALAVAGFLGVVVDPTTAGVSDSKRVMAYDKPNKDS